MKDNTIVLPPDANGGVSIIPPQGCEMDKVEVVDGILTVTFKPQERKLPKSWEEFCENHPIKDGECYVASTGKIKECLFHIDIPRSVENKNHLPDHATAEAILALCQLIQLRNCYNGDWVPDWSKAWFQGHRESVIAIKGGFEEPGKISIDTSYAADTPHLLHFKDQATAAEFLRNFRPLIEKLKPLYGIKEGGEK